MAIKGAIIRDIVGSQFEFEDENGLDWENCFLKNATLRMIL